MGGPGVKLFFISSPSRSCWARLPKAPGEAAAIREGGGRGGPAGRPRVAQPGVGPNGPGSTAGVAGPGRERGLRDALGVAEVEKLSVGQESCKSSAHVKAGRKRNIPVRNQPFPLMVGPVFLMALLVSVSLCPHLTLTGQLYRLRAN